MGKFRRFLYSGIHYAWPCAGIGTVGILMMLLLVGCSGGGVRIPIETPAPETPGPLTTDEEAYYQAVQTDERQLRDLWPQMAEEFSAHAQTTVSATQTPGSRVPIWPTPHESTSAQQMQTVLTAARGRTVPPRLQAIDQHYRAGITGYQEVLDVYNRAFTGQPTALATITNQWNAATAAGEGELDRTVKLLDSFIQRHPRPK